MELFNLFRNLAAIREHLNVNRFEKFRIHHLIPFSNFIIYEATGCGNPGILYLSARKRFGEKTILRFSCKEGHSLVGSINLTCVEGNWSSGMPECVGA